MTFSLAVESAPENTNFSKLKPSEVSSLSACVRFLQQSPAHRRLPGFASPGLVQLRGLITTLLFYSAGTLPDLISCPERP